MTVALWTISHFSPRYELYESESEAASMAAAADYYDAGEHGVIMGVQYDDGRALRPQDWPAFREELERVKAADKAAAAEAARQPRKAAPPRRTIKDPFTGNALGVDASEPSWLGLRCTGTGGRA